MKAPRSDVVAELFCRGMSIAVVAERLGCEPWQVEAAIRRQLSKGVRK